MSKQLFNFRFAQTKGDTSEVILLKRIIFIIALSCCFFGLVWAGMFYTLYGLVPVVILPIFFSIIVIPALIFAHLKKRYKILVFAQLFCITWIGAFIQWNLGSVHDSGAVLIWTFLGPLGAIIFLDKKQAFVWFAMFIFILFVTVIYEPFLSDTPIIITNEQTKVFYLMNFSVTFLIIFLSALYFFNGMEKEKAKIKELLKITDHKNKEITDSIKYARRLQKALLPTIENVKKTLPESFIFFKPKDIVSGDFYWTHLTEDNQTLFAVGDCTGHGVPGALVSVICNNSLNRSVKELKLTKPADILNSARNIVVEEFEKSSEVVHDGMDIALCSLKDKQLQYAGAHNPLWIVRNNKLIEIKANNQSVSKYPIQKAYENHYVDLHDDDTIYIFTDGYRDQFGYKSGKKIRLNGFRKLILEISKLPIEEQKNELYKFLKNWQGNLEQIDDICVMAVKI